MDGGIHLCILTHSEKTMTNNPEGEFIPPELSSQTAAESRNKTLLIVLGVGCGCLTLPIILGIIAAIALPSFLSQASRAREIEASNYLGAMNRSQQTHYLEYGEFASSLEEMDLGFQPETDTYRYEVVLQTDSTDIAYMTAIPQEEELPAMASAVFALENASTVAIICISNGTNPKPPAMATLDIDTETATCPTGSYER